MMHGIVNKKKKPGEKMFHEISPMKLDIAYKKRLPQPDDYVAVTDGKTVLLRKNGGEIEFPTIKELQGDAETQYLFAVDETAFFLYKGNEDCFGDAAERLNMYEIRSAKPMWKAYAASLACRLAAWYKTAVYCGACGAKTVHSDSERAMVCPVCGNTLYPVVSPSVIVLIRDGNRALLTKYAQRHSTYSRYALVAGYAESGESAEETVRREVMEEVGLRVKNITYYKSQPWPVSGTLLFGYYCDLDGDDRITLDRDELSVAEWVERADMPDRSNDISLTSEMMEMFRTGRLY